MGMIGVFVGAMVGGCFGVVVTCLAVAAKRADEQDGIYEPGDKRARDTALPKTDGRTIRFTDPEGVLLFTIPDGDCVTLMYGDGETVAGVCRYLDQDHAEINGVRWRMTEFALQMQSKGDPVFSGHNQMNRKKVCHEKESDCRNHRCIAACCPHNSEEERGNVSGRCKKE